MHAATKGIHHLGLTVADIQETSAFFCDHLGFEIVGEKPDYPALFISDGFIMLTLWQVNRSDQAVLFDRRNNIGLHHFALRVENLNALDSLHSRLQKLRGVCIEFSPEPLGHSGARHMMCSIPGGIRVEFIATA